MWILRASLDDESEPLTLRLLPNGVRTVGRSPAADFSVDAPLVSRLHCRLTVTSDGQLAVEDLQSTNGTFVNDRRVQHAALAEGDKVRVGRVELMVQRIEG